MQWVAQAPMHEMEVANAVRGYNIGEAQGEQLEWPWCWKLGAGADTDWSLPEILVKHRSVLFVTTIFLLCLLSLPVYIWAPLLARRSVAVSSTSGTGAEGLALGIGTCVCFVKAFAVKWDLKLDMLAKMIGCQQSDTSAHFILTQTSCEAFQVTNSKWFLLRCVMLGTSFC